MNAAAPATRVLEEPAFDFRRYFRVFWKFKWVFLVVFGGVCAAILYTTQSAPKIYEAVTTVQINPRTPKALTQIREVIELGTGSYWTNKEFLYTQYQVIASRAVAQRVVEREGLDRDPDFLGLTAIQDPEKLAQASKDADAAALLVGRVAVNPVEGSYLAKIRVEDTKPERAVRLSIALAQAYKDINLEGKMNATTDALVKLARQKQELKAALEAAEANLVDFKQKSRILSISLGERQNVVTQDLLTFNDSAAKTESRLVELRAQLAHAKKTDPLLAAVEEQQLVAQSRVIGMLQEERERLRQRDADLSVRYREKHPQVVAMRQRQELAEKALQSEVDRIRQQVRTKFAAKLAVLQRQVASAEKAFDGYRKLVSRTDARAQRLSEKELEYLQLKRKVEENRRAFDLVSTRLKEVELDKENQYNNVSVLDEARHGRLVRPRLLYNVFFAVGLGTLAGLAVLTLLNFLDKSVKTQEDIESVLGLTFLGVIPSVRGEDNAKVPAPDLYVHTHPKSTVAEMCRSLRTNIQFMSPDRKLAKLLVTSAAPLEGKTMVTTSLAISMAQAGSRVVIVSADMRRPRAHESFGVRGAKGISDWIVENATIEEILHTTSIPNLTLVPCGPIPPNPAEILHTEKFHKLVEEMEKRFDRVLFDSPPMGAVTDPLILAALADGVILIARAGTTTKDMIRHSFKKLQNVNAHVLGCVLNDLDLDAAGYGYYYQRGYYYGAEAEGRRA